MKFGDFAIPATLEEAQAILREKGDAAFPLAGASALQYLPDHPGKTAVDITRIGLDGIETRDGGFRIGATTTLTDVVRYRAEGWVLHEVARLIPTHPIRNASTVGGNIARVFPWSDLPLAFLVLDATIVLRGNDEQRLPTEEFFASQPARLFKNGTLLVAVELPAVQPGTGFAHRKESLTNLAFSMMTSSALLTVKDGSIAEARVAVGAAVPDPHRLHGVEERLTGAPATEDTLEAAVADGVGDEPWKGKHGMSDDYAAHLARVIIMDALTAALTRATGGKS